MAKQSKKAKQQQSSKQLATKKKHIHLAGRPKFWQVNFPGAILLLLLIAGLYVQSMDYDFVLDDKIVLTENKLVKGGIDNLWEILTTESMSGYFDEQQNLIAGGRYRPLSLMTFAIEHEYFGLNKKVYHFGNMLLYMLCCLLIFRVLGQLFPTVAGIGAWFSVPFIAALFYAIHPLHTEAVANIKGRDEILCMLLSMATLYASLQYIVKEKILWLIGAACFFFLAILAKENAITFLAIVPLTVYFFTKADLKKLLIVTAPLAMIFAAYLALRYAVIGYLLDAGTDQQYTLMNDPFVEALNGERIPTIIQTLGVYLKLMFFPHPLTHDYYPYHVPLVNWTDWQALLPLVILAALLVYAIRRSKQKDVYAYSIFFFLITISIVSNLVFSVGTFMNERFLFMPSLAGCIALAYFFVHTLPKVLPKQLSRFTGPAILLIFALGSYYKSFARIPDWSSAKTLNFSAVQVSKNSARSNCYWGYSLYETALEAQDANEKKRILQEAEKFIDKSIAIHPSYIDALRTKAGIAAGYYQMDGDLDALLTVFNRLLRTRRIPYVESYLDYLNDRADQQKLKAFYHQTGYELLVKQIGNADRAYGILRLGAAQFPNDPMLQTDMAAVYNLAGNYQNALTYANNAIALAPNYARAYKVAAKAYKGLGDQANAALMQRQAQQLSK